MKNLIVNTALVIIFLFSFSSCKDGQLIEETIAPNDSKTSADESKLFETAPEISEGNGSSEIVESTTTVIKDERIDNKFLKNGNYKNYKVRNSTFIGKINFSLIAKLNLNINRSNNFTDIRFPFKRLRNIYRRKVQNKNKLIKKLNRKMSLRNKQIKHLKNKLTKSNKKRIKRKIQNLRKRRSKLTKRRKQEIKRRRRFQQFYKRYKKYHRKEK